jgi:7-cyano-7-deazaguanine synthase
MNIIKKAMVLHSGGLDSTVLLHRAVELHGAENVIALGISYGQKHDKELEYAHWHREKLGVTSYDVDLSEVFAFNPDCCALLKDSKKELKHESYADQLKELGGSGTVSAYVPYRNGLFLSFAAAVALQMGCDVIYYGAHKDDAAGAAYPDCTPEFIRAQEDAIEAGTGHKVAMEAPFWNINKAQIVTIGLAVGMSHEDFEHTWSCYEGKDKPCGTCGTCRDRKAAFEANGIMDID